MPSLMIHLLTAYKYNSKASASFFLGNIVPDTVSDWKEKDKTHFRDRPDRLAALRELAVSIDLSNELNHGILLHLFLDCRWDASPMHNFIENYKGDSWFKVHRQETALAGSWLFHHTSWSRRVWEEMLTCPMSVYENAPGVIKENVDDFLRRNCKWHLENNIGPSTVFTPDFVEEFTSDTVVEFRKWLKL
jgi:hypothetical protein